MRAFAIGLLLVAFAIFILWCEYQTRRKWKGTRTHQEAQEQMRKALESSWSGGGFPWRA